MNLTKKIKIMEINLKQSHSSYIIQVEDGNTKMESDITKYTFTDRVDGQKLLHTTQPEPEFTLYIVNLLENLVRETREELETNECIKVLIDHLPKNKFKDLMGDIAYLYDLKITEVE